MTLNNALILVAEDEPFIAIDLALAVEDAGGRVVGPTASVAEGLDALINNRVDGAILDVNLADRDVSPLALRLLNDGVAIVVQTGVGLPRELTSRYPGLRVNLKPCSATGLVDQLAALLSVARIKPAN